MKSIYEELVDRAVERLEGIQAVDVRIGLSYAGVLLEDGSLGLAAVMREPSGPDCGVLDRAGFLVGPAGDLAPMLSSLNPIEAAVGLATINAALNSKVFVLRHAQDERIFFGAQGSVGDILDILEPGADEKIGMVGYFGPVAARLRNHNLVIFELDAQKGQNCVPAREADMFLPDMDVVIITATALINHTIEPLLAACKKAREIVILGPSTPLVPDAWGKRGVTLLGGIKPRDPDRILRIVSEGGGARLIHTAADKINVRLNPK